jgi:four helix bundle protein
MERKGKDLEARLIDFAIIVIKLTESLPKTYAGNYYAEQLIRSGSSPALQYGEDQAAESRKDFIHKMKGALKELRETFINLNIIKKMAWLEVEKVDTILDENNQLISIFVASIHTVETRIKNTRKAVL